MSGIDQVERFLGVPFTDDPIELLQLDVAKCNLVGIDAALQRQLSMVFAHPAGRSLEADDVRRQLRRAAQLLKDSALRDRVIAAHVAAGPRRVARAADRAKKAGERGADTASLAAMVPSKRSVVRKPAADRPVIQLTEFDRLVVSILVGAGGWNNESRGRIVAMAHDRGVPLQGLLRILRGLNNYAQAGGMTLDASVAAVDDVPWRPIVIDEDQSIVDRFVDRLTPDFTGSDPLSTVKLSIVFGSIAIFLGVVLVRLLLFTPEAAPRVPLPVLVDPSPLEATAPRSDASIDAARRRAFFESQPSFRGERLPRRAADAADECASLPDLLEHVERRIRIAHDPAESVFRDWGHAMSTASAGWAGTDRSTRGALRRGLTGVMHVAGAASTATVERLLRQLRPPRGTLHEPLDLWRGAWRAGCLGMLAADPTLPPIVRVEAEKHLDEALGSETASRVHGFDAAARAWLAGTLPEEVRTLEFGGRVYDRWELWLSAQQTLDDDAARDRAIVAAIGAILRTGTDLGREGPSVNVLGRLLQALDYRATPEARDGLLAFFDDETTVSTYDLWVLTSLLASQNATHWFVQQLVVPANADQVERRRLRDSIARYWPSIDERRVEIVTHLVSQHFELGMADTWMEVARALDVAPLEEDATGRSERLLAWRHLNEAAVHLVEGTNQRTYTLIEEIELHLADLAEGSGPVAGGRGGPGNRGGGGGGGGAASGSQGRDGDFAAWFQAPGRTLDDRLDLLTALRQSPGEDLGPVDAAALVRAAFRGKAPAIRDLARDVIVQKFRQGRNVMLQVLDQFDSAGHSAIISEFVQDLTGANLPVRRTTQWELASRLALVEHGLALRVVADESVDKSSSDLALSLWREAVLIDTSASRGRNDTTPARVLGIAVHAWGRHAESFDAGGVGMAAALVALRDREASRLRLAEGPLQEYIARQMTLLDLVALVASASTPIVADEVADITARLTRSLRSSQDVIEQALFVERAIAQVWLARIGAITTHLKEIGPAADGEDEL